MVPQAVHLGIIRTTHHTHPHIPLPLDLCSNIHRTTIEAVTEAASEEGLEEAIVDQTLRMPSGTREAKARHHEGPITLPMKQVEGVSTIRLQAMKMSRPRQSLWMWTTICSDPPRTCKWRTRTRRTTVKARAIQCLLWAGHHLQALDHSPLPENSVLRSNPRNLHQQRRSQKSRKSSMQLPKERKRRERITEIESPLGAPRPSQHLPVLVTNTGILPRVQGLCPECARSKR